MYNKHPILQKYLKTESHTPIHTGGGMIESHFPFPATLSPKPIAYDKPIDPSEMPHISTCTEMTTEDTNVPTQDDKHPCLDPDDKQ